MNPKERTLASLIVFCLLAILTVSYVNAQEGLPGRDTSAPEAVAASSDFIPIQGRLTDSSGTPINGIHTLIARMYDVSTGGTALCQDTHSPTIVNGLFTFYFNAASCPIDGRKLYLGIEVDGDGEMYPREYIDNVPYAWSIRPGAETKSSSYNSILELRNLGSGAGLWSYSKDGTGVYAESLNGAALFAAGKIMSNSPTVLWISGNGVRPFHQNDTTIIDMNTVGGATIYRGADPGFKNVMLPITIPATLYGQNVRITDLDLEWVGATSTDMITAVLMRRQTGVCSTSGCYATILFDVTDRVCDSTTFPSGCTIHYDLISNNLLSEDSGVIYLTIEFSFNGSTSPINFGGARLTLTHFN